MTEKIVVTGAAGFIGSNLVRALNRNGEDAIIAVDHLLDGTKFVNLAPCRIHDFVDRDDFLALLRRRDETLTSVRAVLHQGACSNTTTWDGRHMMRLNFEYSKQILGFCMERGIPLIYASSAAVYGKGPHFSEQQQNESPLNVYAYSKVLFDRWARCRMPTGSQVVGLRYFNVYGPNEAHKGAMASMVFRLYQQLCSGDRVELFGETANFGPGEQRRDFVHVEDVVATILWFLQHGDVSGIFNVGTGHARSFNELAGLLIDAHDGEGEIEYISFPASLRQSYQSFTEADVRRLRESGCSVDFRDLEQGVVDYVRWLKTFAETS